MSAIDRRRRGFRAPLLNALAAGLALGCAASQAQPAPTDADIVRASKVRPVITEQDIEAAKKRHPMPSEQELARVPVPATPDIDALPAPQSTRQLNLGQLARGFDALSTAKSGQNELALDRSLLIFVSFSMPRASLDRLVDQAAKASATLILRGLVDDSLQRTVMRAQALIGARQVGFQIDPQAFDRFAVEVTPTFVLLLPGATDASCASNACIPSSRFASASGDVSLDYALEFFKRSAFGFGRDADSYLAKLKGR